MTIGVTTVSGRDRIQKHFDDLVEAVRRQQAFLPALLELLEGCPAEDEEQILDGYGQGGSLFGVHVMRADSAKNVANYVRAKLGLHRMDRAATAENWGSSPGSGKITYTVTLPVPIAGYERVAFFSYDLPDTCTIEYQEEVVKRAIVHCGPTDEDEA